MLKASLMKAAKGAAEENNPKCYFCEVPVAGREYTVKQTKAVDLFLKMNPQWLSFGKVFDDKARLCNQGYCLAAHFENWRLDYFGINSPRGMRSPRINQEERDQAEKKAEALIAADEAAVAAGSDGHQETKVEDLLRRTGASLASSLAEIEEGTGDVDSSVTESIDNRSKEAREESPRKMTLDEALVQDEHEFEGFVEDRRNALKAIADRSSTLDQDSNELSDQLRKNREERLKVARRLQEMREKQPELEMRKLERQKEMIVERKRDLFEQMLQARMEKEEAQKKVDRLDLQQRIALMKIEEYSRLRKADDSAVEDRMKNRDRLQADLEPALKHMTHVNDAHEILERGLAGGGDEENSTAITQELQHALREAYTQKQEELLEQRKQLTAGRFELESRLGQLKEFERSVGEEKDDDLSEDEDQGDEPLLDDHENALNDDEPFEAAFRLATDMGNMARQNTEKLLQRIARNREESEWLEDYPETEVWKNVSQRAQEDQQSQVRRRAMGEVLQQYFEAAKVKDVYRDKEEERQALDAAALYIMGELLNEACAGMVTAFHREFTTTKNKITNVLDKTVVDILLGTGNFREMLRIDGSEYLTHGLINELRRKCYAESCAYEEEGGRALFQVNVSQENCSTTFVDRAFGMGYGWSRLPEPQKEWELPVGGVIDMNSHLEDEEMDEDMPRREIIAQAEVRHWDGVYLEAAPTSPVMLPNIRGQITILKLLYRKYNQSSMLIAGLHIGRFVVWNVPHPVLESVVDTDGVEKVLPQVSAPMLTSVSPELNSVDACPIIDIREGTINSVSVVMMYQNGHIRVWDLNPVSVAGRRKAANHLRNMFPTDPASKFVPMLPSLVFHINALEMSLPGLNPKKETEYLQLEQKIAYNEENKVHIRRNKAKQARSKPLAGGARLGETAQKEHYDEPGVIFGTRRVRQPPQPGKFPTQTCFHPSFSLVGRNPSIMVGTEGGDVLKFNMDYRVPDIAAPIVNLPPFVTAEFVHPTNQPEVYLKPGETTLKGNKVYRELFHYHKSPIVFLGVMHRTSDTIVTIDEDGHVALWKYAEKYFGGTVSFRPHLTRRLNTEFYKQIRRTGNTRPGMEEPDPEDARHLRVRKREKITEEEAAPTLMAHFLKQEDDDEKEPPQTHLRETYYPILSKEGNGRFIEYSSTRRAGRPSSSGSGGSIRSKADSFLRTYTERKLKETKERGKKEKDAAAAAEGPETDLLATLSEAEDDVSVLTGDHSLQDTQGSVSTDGDRGKETIKITQWDEDTFDAGVTWSSQYVEEMTYQTTVMEVEHPVVQSEDGEEVFIALTYREDNILSKDVAGVEPYTDYVMIVTLSLRDLRFKLPYPKFTLKRGEEFHQFHVGPVTEETLTRLLYVHTSEATRLFSLETGDEITTHFGAKKGQGHFPYQSSLAGFEPQLMALCPSQRVIALAGPGEDRVEVNFFHHVIDGIDEEKPEDLNLHPYPTNDYNHYKDSLLSPSDRAHLSQPEKLLKSLSSRSVLVLPVEPDQTRVEARVEAKRAVEYLWEAFLVALDKKDDAVRRQVIAADVYGSNTNLGRVHPTHWPPGRVERPFHFDTFDITKVVMRDDDSDEEDGDIAEMETQPPPQQTKTDPGAAPVDAVVSNVSEASGEKEKADKPDIYNTVRNTVSLDAFSAWEGGSNFRLPEDWRVDPAKDPFLSALLAVKADDNSTTTAASNVAVGEANTLEQVNNSDSD